MAITWGDVQIRIQWITKKDVYLGLSVVLLLGLTVALVNDFVEIAVLEDPPFRTTQGFTMALLVSLEIYRIAKHQIHLKKAIALQGQGLNSCDFGGLFQIVSQTQRSRVNE